MRYSIISDLDYIEQVGSHEIKALFQIDTKEIKTDVIENIKSLDGDALVEAIEKALSNGDWKHATQVWSYIKARRRKLRNDLNEDDAAKLDEFLISKRTEHIYILCRGALENYLPVGHSSKDLDRLIRLLAQDNFWEQLLQQGKAELELIATNLLPGTAG